MYSSYYIIWIFFHLIFFSIQALPTARERYTDQAGNTLQEELVPAGNRVSQLNSVKQSLQTISLSVGTSVCVSNLSILSPKKCSLLAFNFYVNILTQMNGNIEWFINYYFLLIPTLYATTHFVRYFWKKQI